MLRTKQLQTETDWQNQKHHVETEFLCNRINQEVNIFVFELDATEREIVKHVQQTSFGTGCMRISSDVKNYENKINKIHMTKEI